MGRPPSNGGPSFRFNPNEVAEMEGILQAHNCLVPQREILVALADKFSNSAERSGRAPVQMKQVWNWFQNRRYALRAKSAKPPVKLSVSPMPQHDSSAARNVSQAPQNPSVPAANVRNVPQVPQPVPTPMAQSVGKNGTDNSQMEFEAKSARDGAWYDVATFLSHRSVETNDPEVLVRFAGFGPEEDEWVNVRKHVRQRSLPCESSECVAVLPGDLILCFQEGKEQALYFDAHVLDAQRRRHDVRGCRCRFLVRYDHDQSEEIVPLRKVCRRPETDYRMQQLHADSGDMKQSKIGSEPHDDNNVKAYPPVEVTVKQPNVDGPAETIPKPANAEMPADSGPLPLPVSFANISVTTSVAPTAHSIEPSASATIWSPHSNVSVATTLAPLASKIPVMPAAAPIANSGDPGVTIAAAVTSSVPLATTVAPVVNSSVPGATIMAPCAPDIHTAPAGVPVADFSVPIVPNTPSAANSTVPLIPTAALAVNSSVPGATVVDPVASSIHVPQASIPDANSSAPIVPTTASAANANVHVSETQAPGANSIAPTVPNMVPSANSSVPIALIVAPDTSSSVPADPTVAPTANSGAPTASFAEAPVANSCIPVAVTREAPFATNSSDHIAPIVVPLADSSAPTALSAEAPITNSSVSVAMTTEAPFATNSVHIAPTVAPPADSSFSTALDAEAPIANCSVPVAMVTGASFATNSSVHIAPTMAPAGASSAPTALNAEAPLADSSVPLPMTTDTPFAISSSVHLAVTPADHSSAPSALSAEAPIANSDVPVAMTTEASFATNSSVPGASDVPPVTENVLLEKFSESGSAGNVENTNAQSPNLAIASGTDTSAVPEEEAGESMQLG